MTDNKKNQKTATPKTAAPKVEEKATEVSVEVDARGIPVYIVEGALIRGLGKAHFMEGVSAENRKVAKSEHHLYIAACAEENRKKYEERVVFFAGKVAAHKQKAEDALREPSDEEKIERQLAAMEDKKAALLAALEALKGGKK